MAGEFVMPTSTPFFPTMQRAAIAAASRGPMINARYDDRAGVVTRHGDDRSGRPCGAGLAMPNGLTYGSSLTNREAS